MRENNTIELTNICKSFNNTLVLDNINLTIYKGDIITFIGDNGAGKSTIIKMISGLIYQDSGTIHLFGMDSRAKKTKDLCEYVFESGAGFYGYLTAYENIRYFLGLNKIKFYDVMQEFYSLCHEFNFEKHLNKKVDELSQGNRQKMALILSFLCSAEILLLDEPTNGLDQNSINILSNILIKKNEKSKMTFLITSHDIHFLKKIHSKIVMVKDKKATLMNDDYIDSLEV